MIRSIDGISLSAEYRHNVGEGDKKLDFHPRRYDYVNEGYSFMHHDLFKNAKDSVLSNYSKLDLTDKIKMSNVTETKMGDQVDIVLYTMLKAHNGKYLRVAGDKIYADGKTREEDPRIEYDSSYMFKFERKWDEVREESYIEIMNGDLYFRMNPFNYTVELMDRKLADKNDLFKWQVNTYVKGGHEDDRLLIYSYLDQPWGYDFDYPILADGSVPKYLTQEFSKSYTYKSVEADGIDEEHSTVHYIPYHGVKRYWSVYDGYCPERIWDGDFKYDGSPKENLVKANGILWKNKRSGLPGRYYPNSDFEASGETTTEKDEYSDIFANASNNYIFKMENGSFADPNSILLGYDGKIRWVQYYNDFYNRFFNNTLNPKMIIDDIRPNFLVDVPYETQFDNEEKIISFLMSSGRQKIDLMEAKNIETPSYRYTVKGGNR